MQRDIQDDAPRCGASRAPLAPRARRIAAGAVLGGGGFAAASVAGIAGVHLAGQATGIQVRAGDEARIWVNNPAEGDRVHASDRRQLPCGDINLWGDDIKHGQGTYTVVSEKPTGHDQKVLEGTWQYARKADGRQVLAVLPGPALVDAAQAAGATPRSKGLRFAVKVRHAHVDDERHFWVAACPPPAIPPPTAAVSAAHAVRAAVPSTGVGDNELGGLLLVTAGGGCLGAAAAARRERRCSVAAAAAGTASAGRGWHAHVAAGAATVRRCRDSVAATVPGRQFAAAVAALALTGVVAGPGRDATVSALRTLVSHVEQLVAPPTPPARVVPVEVDAGSSSAGDPELSNIDYPFPANSTRPGR
jgi:hypothetical protein